MHNRPKPKVNTLYYFPYIWGFKCMTKVHTNDVKTRALCWFYVLPYGMVLSCLIEMKPDEYIYIINISWLCHVGIIKLQKGTKMVHYLYVTWGVVHRNQIVRQHDRLKSKFSNFITARLLQVAISSWFFPGFSQASTSRCDHAARSWLCSM